MRRIHLLIAPLLLAGCGSDDNDNAATTPTTAAPSPTPSPSPSPTPSPTPAPTPSPTPTPSASGYTPYAQLTGEVALPTAQSGFSTASNPPAPTGFRSFGQGATVQYNATARGYTVTNGGSTDAFVASELDTNAAAGTIRYAKSNGSSLTITQPGAGGRGFDYVRFLRLVSGTTATTFLTGVATQPADLPTSGTATFSRTAVMGEAYVTSGGTTTAYSLSRSTLTLTIDYAAQRASGRLVIIGTPTAGGADVTLSTVDASTDFSGNGALSAVSGDYTFQSPSTLIGALFGPRGSEVGLLFFLQGQSASGARLTLTAAGAAGN